MQNLSLPETQTGYPSSLDPVELKGGCSLHEKHRIMPFSLVFGWWCIHCRNTVAASVQLNQKMRSELGYSFNLRLSKKKNPYMLYCYVLDLPPTGILNLHWKRIHLIWTS